MHWHSRIQKHISYILITILKKFKFICICKSKNMLIYHHCVISNIEEATTNKNLILNDMISQHHKMIWSKWEQEDLQKLFKSFGSVPLKMREFFPYTFLCCTSHHCNSNHLCIIELWWFFQMWKFKILKAIHQTFFWGYTINVSLAWTL